MATWKSAAFGCSPPITPSASSASTRSSCPGSASAQARAVSSLTRICVFTTGRIAGSARLTRSGGTPRCAPSRNDAIDALSRTATQRAICRMPSCSAASAHASAPSIVVRSPSSNSGGAGYSASSARAIRIVPQMRRPSSRSTGTVELRKRSSGSRNFWLPLARSIRR